MLICEKVCVSSMKNLINRKPKRSRKRKLKLRMKELTWEQGTVLRFASLCIRNTGSIRPLLKWKIKITCINVLYYSGPLWLHGFKTSLLLFSSALLIYFFFTTHQSGFFFFFSWKAVFYNLNLLIYLYTFIYTIL